MAGSVLESAQSATLTAWISTKDGQVVDWKVVA
jgi:hypothetical protein